MNNTIITVNKLNKAISGRLILSDVSFEIEKNTLVSLIGPNGAGKSTLVKILLGFDHAYSGTVSIDSQERIAYIPQMQIHDTDSIALSVREYIRVGTARIYNPHLKPHLDLEQILTHVGVDPHCLDQSLWTLSGGERQRVAIARALLSEPSVLVLDEPLSAVDHASRQDLYDLIRHLQQDHNMTVILVSHDINSVLPISDQVLCLNQTIRSDCHPAHYNTDGGDGSTVPVHHHC